MSNTIRVLTWNVRRAHRTNSVWNYLQELSPDVAVLQEVSSIPENILLNYAIKSKYATGKKGNPQKFSTVILVRGRIGDEILLFSDKLWVSKELCYFSGNLVASQILPDKGPPIKVVSVYSPAWPANPERLKNIDVTGVKLTDNPDVWVHDLLWVGLSHLRPHPDESWIVAGDFNASETFDVTFGSGNKELLKRMSNLGLIECLRYSKGKLTPTYKNVNNKKIEHQIDHLFVTSILAQRLIKCDVRDRARVFDKGLSDHLPIIADFRLPD
ncbi:endonuclease/exonuclease/phosphatase family protein [Candidatus Gottesmanbacteria bacterium]|nr:endonuclease/exonuclease/phosphatase family protein [Candidatus Gottesmanbacteria bacterium]